MRKKEELSGNRNWHLIDAKGEILGRLASKTASILMGKAKPEFKRYLDIGDYVVVINAGEIKVSGKKENQKTYYRHSGYPAGFKKTPLSKLRSTRPEEIIKHAIKGMLPANKLRPLMLKRLLVFRDANHPYETKLDHKEGK